MSHISCLKTKLIQRDFIKQALTDLGYTFREGALQLVGHEGDREAVDMMINTGPNNSEIGLRATANGYEVVADWWGVRDLTSEQFMNRLTQRYAYVATRAKLAEQGFDLVEETTDNQRQIRMVLRRTA